MTWGSMPSVYAIAAATLASLATGLLIASPSRFPAPQEAARPVSGFDRLFRGRVDTGLSPEQRVLAGAVAAAASAVGLWGFLGPPAVGVGLAIGLAGAVAIGWLESGAAKRRRWRLVLETPQALDLLAAALVAGLPLRRAVTAVIEASPGPVADDLGLVLREIELGVPDAHAWRVLSDHPQLGRVSADLARSVESGTMLAQALELHARDARTERRLAMEIRARAVGVRSVLPLMLCFIPSFLLLGVVPTLVSAVLNAFSF